MGLNLSVLKNNTQSFKNSPLFNRPLSETKETFGSYKSICENFYLDQEEFQSIFGDSSNSFAIWDSGQTGLCDALQMFSGIILLSSSKLDDKIRFLFEIYDLNEENSLDQITIEFMMFNCLKTIF